MTRLIVFVALLLATPAYAEWGTICDPNEWRVTPEWCASRPGAKKIEIKPAKKIDKDIANQCRERLIEPGLTERERKVLQDCADYPYEGY
jgi:hypothetical protein